MNISYKDFGIAHGFHNIGLGNEHPQLIENVTNQKWPLTISQLAQLILGKSFPHRFCKFSIMWNLLNITQQCKLFGYNLI